MASSPKKATGGGRIPASLQQVFLASNRGEAVHVPPSDRTADKVYGAIPSTRIARIPLALQAIFLASNRGEEIDLVPADGSASRVFKRHWRLQGKQDLSKVLPGDYVATPPQKRFEALLESRGYSTRRFMTTRSGYYCKPTDAQKAGYGAKILSSVKQGMVAEFRKIMDAGVSPNACNPHGESILHLVCRRGNFGMFRVLQQAGVTLQVADDYGRTPMHDACWAPRPSFELTRLLMQADPFFFVMADARGALPLAYVPKDNWGEWNHFLDKIIDIYYPVNPKNSSPIPPLCRFKPHSRPVPDKKHALPHSLASLVASGAMDAQDVIDNMGLNTDSRHSRQIDDETVDCSEDTSYDDDSESETDYTETHRDDDYGVQETILEEDDEDEDDASETDDEAINDLISMVEELRKATIEENDRIRYGRRSTSARF